MESFIVYFIACFILLVIAPLLLSCFQIPVATLLVYFVLVNAHNFCLLRCSLSFFWVGSSGWISGQKLLCRAGSLVKFLDPISNSGLHFRYVMLLTTVVVLGRARADSAHYTVVGDYDRDTLSKDEANRLRERMINKALKRIDTLDPAAIRHKITELQRKAKMERDIESKGAEFRAAVRQSRTHEGEYQLR